MSAGGLKLLNVLHFRLQRADTPETRRATRQVAMTFASPLTPEQRNEAIANSYVAMAQSEVHSYAIDLILIMAWAKETA